MAGLNGGLLAQSQYDHDVLFSLLNGVGGRIPFNVRTATVDQVFHSSFYSWSSPLPSPFAAGSLWAWAIAGKLTPNQTADVALTAVDQDMYGETDWIWTGNNTIALSDPNLMLAINTAPLGSTVEVRAYDRNGAIQATVLGGTPTKWGASDVTFNLAQIPNTFGIKLAPTQPTKQDLLTVIVTIRLTNGTVWQSWLYNSAFSDDIILTP